ncbi:MAG: hypothetical protein SAJ12_22400 [Jaaginema sp. PMC 1079.18]|nr:hypothetical protein [Jaaginema sp. PMC 1080.18]MEC4853741.1 hypothetical protein [Jaaginema sp. PMC 1079.18]MEC4866513.1 hypothetical protein [Jaaginema sp. PMC 1078.18]
MLSQIGASLMAKANIAILAGVSLLSTVGTPALASESPLADGVYLYGQASQPEVINSEYLVFEVKEGVAQGAIYYPQSEFNCFTADINYEAMNLAIVDPFDNAVYSYEIAMNAQGDVAGRDRTPVVAGLEGYHALETLSDRDRELLQTCQNAL